MNDLIEYTKTNDIMGDACNIIDSAQRVAIQSANISLVLRNWLLGKRISEEELNGKELCQQCRHIYCHGHIEKAILARCRSGLEKFVPVLLRISEHTK